MRRIALVGGAIVLVVVVAASALWFAGRGAIESRLNQEVARLETQGYEIELGEREIGGFPAGYEVTYTDVVITDPRRGIRYELPRITGRGEINDPGGLTLHFPPKFSVVVPVEEGVRSEYEALPEALTIDVESDALVLRLAEPNANAVEMSLAANWLMLITAAGEGGELGAAVELAGLEGSAIVPTDPQVGTVRGRASVGRLDYAMSLLDPDDVRTTAEGSAETVTLSSVSNLRTAEQWQALLAGEAPEGEAEFSYQSGPAISQVKIQGAEDGMDGTVEQSAGAGGGVVRIGDGRIEMQVSSQNNTYRLLPEAADQPIRGEIVLASLEMVYDAPIAPSEEMRPFTMRLALSGLDVAESLWQLADPNGVLDHETAHLVAEVTGTGRLVPGPTDGSSAMRPLELGRIEIVAATLDALGAEVMAEGGVEFLQPLNTPLGTVTIRARNLLDVVGKLAELGLLEQGAYQMAALFSSIYARPGASEDELVSEIEFTPEGIIVNDLPVLTP